MKVLINVKSDEGGDEGCCEDGDECGNDWFWAVLGFLMTNR